MHWPWLGEQTLLSAESFTKLKKDDIDHRGPDRRKLVGQSSPTLGLTGFGAWLCDPLVILSLSSA